MPFKTNNPRGDKVWVFDRDKFETRENNIGDVAHQRDFYRLDVEAGNDPFFLEKMLGDLEGNARIGIKHILDHNTLPSDEYLDYLINFIALMAVRGPVHRNRMNDFQEQVMKKVLSLTVSTKEIWDKEMAKAKANGYEIANESYEDMRDFIRNDKFKIIQDRTQAVSIMLDTASTAVDLLAQRNWCIVNSDKNSSFICSDNPVGLSWIKQPKIWRSPGFGLINTMVTIPLSPTTALRGTFEEFQSPTMTLNATQTAAFNNYALQEINRFVYSTAENMAWLNSSGQICSKEEWFEIFKKRSPVFE